MNAPKAENIGKETKPLGPSAVGNIPVKTQQLRDKLYLAAKKSNWSAR